MSRKLHKYRCFTTSLSEIKAIAGIKICHEPIVCSVTDLWITTLWPRRWQLTAIISLLLTESFQIQHLGYKAKRWGKKLPHIVFLHLNFLFTSYWIVPRKRTNVALNFELWICHNRANSPGYALYILCRKALGDKVIYFQFQFIGIASF